MSTRIIGAIIMTHGDDNGLVLPPAIAPIQVVVVPVAQHKQGVLEAAAASATDCSRPVCRVKMDDTDNSPGWKFAEYEMKGVPLRLELGPKDIEKGQCACGPPRQPREDLMCPSAELAQRRSRRCCEALRDGLYQTRAGEPGGPHHVAAAHAWRRSWPSRPPATALSRPCGAASRACEEAMKEQAGLTSPVHAV